MSSYNLSPDPGVSKVASYRTQVPGLTAKGDQRQFVQHNYTDHSNEKGDVNFARRYNLVCFDGDKQVEEDSSKQDATALILQSPTFPLKLHMILDKIEDTDSSIKNAISWLPHGRAFHLRNSDIFKREVLPKYFKNCKMSSFYRQINLYGFVRLTTGCETGAYYHEYFLRGRAFLTKNIIRTKVKGTKIRPTSAPEDEPNFYAMTPVCSTEEDDGISSMQAGMPLGVGTPHTQADNSVALLQAIRDMERIKYFGNAMSYAPQQTMQNSFMGSMAAEKVNSLQCHINPSSPQRKQLVEEGNDEAKLQKISEQRASTSGRLLACQNVDQNELKLDLKISSRDKAISSLEQVLDENRKSTQDFQAELQSLVVTHRKKEKEMYDSHAQKEEDFKNQIESLRKELLKAEIIKMLGTQRMDKNV